MADSFSPKMVLRLRTVRVANGGAGYLALPTDRTCLALQRRGLVRSEPGGPDIGLCVRWFATEKGHAYGR